MALKEDPSFRVWVEKYARDEQLFFDHFANAFARLLSLGCDGQQKQSQQQQQQQPLAIPSKAKTASEEASQLFREHAMHGSVLAMQKYRPLVGIDIKMLIAILMCVICSAM
jgi:catalase (peroxidase I)